MAMIEREGADRLSRRLVLLHHQVEREANPVLSAPALQWINKGYWQRSKKSISVSNSRRVGRLVAFKGKSKNATPLACAVRTSNAYHVSFDDPPRRFRIEAR